MDAAKCSRQVWRCHCPDLGGNRLDRSMAVRLGPRRNVSSPSGAANTSQSCGSVINGRVRPGHKNIAVDQRIDRMAIHTILSWISTATECVGNGEYRRKPISLCKAVLLAGYCAATILPSKRNIDFPMHPVTADGWSGHKIRHSKATPQVRHRRSRENHRGRLLFVRLPTHLTVTLCHAKCNVRLLLYFLDNLYTT